MHTAAHLAIDWVEQGRVPDSVIRAGIRRLLKERLSEIHGGDVSAAADAGRAFIAEMDRAPIALVPEKANQQHYEVPAAFFGKVLGKRRKYSSCWWPAGTVTLDVAESAALATTCERAQLADGQDVLELGCGWGSLTLWMAEHYPHSRITGISNSHTQRVYIEAEAARRGLNNVHIRTHDMNRFDATQRYHRIVSVEMFEHMRNWRELLRRLSSWLHDDGLFFMHVFAHRTTPYAFVERDQHDWMSRYFFSGGMMPGDDLALHFQDDLRLLARWRWDGTHYQRTANAWLANMDAQRAEIEPLLEQTYGREDAPIWWMRWRIFFMSCAELFGYDRGQQWWVSHYLFARRT